ncbi:hypothetical protein CYMTET_50938, partial [Cymbomonas tetramitiformis]
MQDGNGVMDYNEFIRKVMPEDYPDTSAESNLSRIGAYATGNMHEHRPGDERRGKSTITPAFKRRVPVDVLEKMLREKVMARAKGGRYYLRQAFKHFDKDASGGISKKEFRQVLDKFHIMPHEEDFQTLVKRYDLNRDGVIDWNEFCSQVMPPDYTTMDSDKDHAAATYRTLTEKANRKLESLEHSFRRHAHKDGMMTVPELMDICARENVDMRPENLRAIAESCVGNAGMLSYHDFVRLLEESDAEFAEEQSSRAGRGYMGGFEQPFHKVIVARDGQVKMNVPRIELLLRDKLQAKSRGGATQLRAAFKHFDRDGSGGVTYEEFQNVLEKFNIRLVRDDFDALMRKYDVNGDGLIDWAEFTDRLLPPDYPTKAYDAKIQLADKLESQITQLQSSLDSLDKRRNGGRATGALPATLVVKAANKMEVSPDDLWRLVDTCSEEGDRVDYRKFVGTLLQHLRRYEEDKLQEEYHDRDGRHRRGLIEALTHGTGRYGREAPREPHVPSFPQKMTVQDVEKLVREKIQQKCK